jgi:hypothetical protein
MEFVFCDCRWSKRSWVVHVTLVARRTRSITQGYQSTRETKSSETRSLSNQKDAVARLETPWKWPR